jgi:hypothetical protein
MTHELCVLNGVCLRMRNLCPLITMICITTVEIEDATHRAACIPAAGRIWPDNGDSLGDSLAKSQVTAAYCGHRPPNCQVVEAWTEAILQKDPCTAK